jgi:pullulanase/glycogen debranching enzyme
MKSVVVDHTPMTGKVTPLCESVITDGCVTRLHVRGFTRHPSSGVAENRRGTYAGLIEKIPYLRDLGITAVELLPVFQFDPRTAQSVSSITGATRRSRSLRHIRPTVQSRIPWARSTSFAIWSKHYIVLA